MKIVIQLIGCDFYLERRKNVESTGLHVGFRIGLNVVAKKFGVDLSHLQIFVPQQIYKCSDRETHVTQLYLADVLIVPTIARRSYSAGEVESIMKSVAEKAKSVYSEFIKSFDKSGAQVVVRVTFGNQVVVIGE